MNTDQLNIEACRAGRLSAAVRGLENAQEYISELEQKLREQRELLPRLEEDVIAAREALGLPPLVDESAVGDDRRVEERLPMEARAAFHKAASILLRHGLALKLAGRECISTPLDEDDEEDEALTRLFGPPPRLIDTPDPSVDSCSHHRELYGAASRIARETAARIQESPAPDGVSSAAWAAFAGEVGKALHGLAMDQLVTAVREERDRAQP